MIRQDDPSEELARLRARVSELEVELRTRDEFIVEAAHELRNPISPLVLHVQRLINTARKSQDGTVSSAWLGDQLDLLNRRVARFMSALNRILDVSRIHTGQIDLVPEDGVDLCEVAREVAANFERELLASRSELTLEAPTPVVGRWDRMRLDQIVSNLVSNAIRYGNSNPIQVSAYVAEGCAQLEVRDAGLGIEEADQARIFGRFERAHTQNRAGFGVGLWIVHELCTAMGGSVTVQSSPLVGSTFQVRLPIHGSGDDR